MLDYGNTNSGFGGPRRSPLADALISRPGIHPMPPVYGGYSGSPTPPHILPMPPGYGGSNPGPPMPPGRIYDNYTRPMQAPVLGMPTMSGYGKVIQGAWR